jgi:hypothetical protein
VLGSVAILAFVVLLGISVASLATIAKATVDIAKTLRRWEHDDGGDEGDEDEIDDELPPKKAPKQTPAVFS